MHRPTSLSRSTVRGCWLVWPRALITSNDHSTPGPLHQRFCSYSAPSSFSFSAGKSRHYPRYSLNSSDNEDSPIHRSIYAQPYNAIPCERQSNFTYRSVKRIAGQSGQDSQASLSVTTGAGGGGGGGHTTTPSSENGSSATLTDAEASLARENTLLVNNGE